jgi:hypothetical protein
MKKNLRLTLSTRNRRREDSIRKQILHIPLRRTLSLPRPEDPAGCLLIRIELRLDEASNVVLVVVGHRSHRASVLASAVTHLGRSAERAVVACALVLAIEPLSAVGDAAGELACNGPFTCRRHLVAEIASGSDVAVEVLRDLAVVEDLVVVRVEEQVPHTRAPAVPGSYALEGIVEGDGHIVIPEVAPAVHVELADSIHIQVGPERFVQELDGGDGGVRSMVVTDLVENVYGVGNGVACAPCNASVFTRVVEAVL